MKTTKEPSPPQSKTLQAPPEGYAWSMHPEHGYILIPLNAPPMQAPPRQPYSASSYPTYSGPSYNPPPVAQVEATCTIVKPGNRDTYMELLNTVPDISGPADREAMHRDLSVTMEYNSISRQDSDATNAFKNPGALKTNSDDLKK